MLFCVLSLFVFVGIVMFLTPKVYASAVIHSRIGSSTTVSTSALIIVDTSTPLPTATTPALVPTDTPIPIPTNTPVPIPTDTPIPTVTATTVPTHTPTPVPVITPTTVAKPTSTSVAGVPPPGGMPTVGPTQQNVPTPMPSPSGMTATPSSSGLPPTSTGVVPSPTANGYSTTVTGQNNEKLLLPTMPEIAIGSSVLGAAAVVGWFVWRRKQGALVSSTEYPLAQTLPAYDSSQLSYAQTVYAAGATGMVRENRSFYQEGSTALAMTHMPETPPPHQAVMDTLEPSLETIMRQAQTGLFALPDKEVYS